MLDFRSADSDPGYRNGTRIGAADTFVFWPTALALGVVSKLQLNNTRGRNCFKCPCMNAQRRERATEWILFKGNSPQSRTIRMALKAAGCIFGKGYLKLSCTQESIEMMGIESSACGGSSNGVMEIHESPSIWTQQIFGILKLNCE